MDVRDPGLTASDRALVGVVAVVVAATAVFVAMVVRLAFADPVTPVLAAAALSFGFFLTATAMGLIQLTRPFDTEHPGFALDQARFAVATVRRMLGRRGSS